MTQKTPVAILGATGAVGQKFVTLLADHPWFEIAALAASERSAGKKYGDAVRWLDPTPLPRHIADMPVLACEPGIPGAIAFSGMDASVAGPIEQAFAAAGRAVVTNTRNHRMDADVPLLIPEINPESLSLLTLQRSQRQWKGFIVANPNCSTIVLAMALAPLHRAFGVEKVFVATMQATSGAGYPGVPSLDILGNVIPGVPGEEEKMESETRKILGANILISAHTNRVAVVDGHTESISVGLRKKATPEQAAEALAAFRAPADVEALPTSPRPPIVVHAQADRPQPRLDVGLGHGMQTSVGRVRACPILDIRLTALGHNTIRGAAGAAVLNAELLVSKGLVPAR
ncbi:MAG: aspartate-semialdehyde dehydrogenase [Gemmatimonadetes bacterium]|nr:aspartate-semialdehyde dehydrogenase [Gemmatimonadota bacterium]